MSHSEDTSNPHRRIDGPEEEEEFVDWLERTFDMRAIRNPYNESTVMVILTVNARAIMGGIRELDDGLLPVYQPLMFAEIPIDIDPETKRIKAIGPQFSKHFTILSPLDWMFFKVKSLYVMKANRPHDVALAGEYELAVKTIIGMDSDIQIVEGMPPDLRAENVRPLGKK